MARVQPEYAKLRTAPIPRDADPVADAVSVAYTITMRCMLLVLIALAAPACDAHITDLRPSDAGDVGDVSDAESGVELVLSQAPFVELTTAEVTGDVTLVQRADARYELRVGPDFACETYASVVMVLSPFDTLPRQLDPQAGDQNLGDIVGPGEGTWLVQTLPSFPMYAYVYSRAAGDALARAELRP